MSWRELTAQQFSFLIFVLVVGLLLDMAFAILTNTLWAIGIATPYLLATLVWYYIDARVKSKSLVQFMWQSFFLFTMTVIFMYFGPQWTPYPHFTFAIIQYVAAFFIFIILGTSLCERYIQPKLGSINKKPI